MTAIQILCSLQTFLIFKHTTSNLLSFNRFYHIFTTTTNIFNKTTYKSTV